MHKIYFVWVSFTLSLSLSFHLSLSFFSLLSLTPCSGGIQRKIERKGYYKRERNRGRQREEKQRERDMCYSESYGYVAHSYKQDYPFLPELQHQNLSEYPYFSRRIYKPLISTLQSLLSRGVNQSPIYLQEMLCPTLSPLLNSTSVRR